MNKYRGPHKKIIGWLMNNAPASRQAIRAAFSFGYSATIIQKTIDALIVGNLVTENDGIIDLNREIVK